MGCGDEEIWIYTALHLEIGHAKGGDPERYEMESAEALALEIHYYGETLSQDPDALDHSGYITIDPSDDPR